MGRLTFGHAIAVSLLAGRAFLPMIADVVVSGCAGACEWAFCQAFHERPTSCVDLQAAVHVLCPAAGLILCAASLTLLNL